jgi:hypothetical protein
MVYYTSDCMFLDFLHRLVVKQENKVSGIRTVSILSLKGGESPYEMGRTQPAILPSIQQIRGRVQCSLRFLDVSKSKHTDGLPSSTSQHGVAW